MLLGLLVGGGIALVGLLVRALSVARNLYFRIVCDQRKGIIRKVLVELRLHRPGLVPIGMGVTVLKKEGVRKPVIAQLMEIVALREYVVYVVRFLLGLGLVFRANGIEPADFRAGRKDT